MDTPGSHRDTATPTERAYTQADERAAEVTARISEEIQRLDERTKALTEEIGHLEEGIRRQESRGAAPLGTRKASRR